MNKVLLSVVGLGLVGIGIWAGPGFFRDNAGGPPLPGTAVDAPVVAGNSAGKAPEMSLPATRPAPAVVVAAQQPSFLYIKYLPDNPGGADDAGAPANDFGTPFQFPPARLHMTGKPDEPVTALVFSDDPKEAMEKDWAGDRYYFSMTLQTTVGDDRQLDGLDWIYSASLTEKEETGNGIFLHGDQYHLEPVQARVHFDGQAPHLLVKIAGEFLQYDTTNPNSPPKRCQVTGVLAPRVETK
jgi:hypothetical protein